MIPENVRQVAGLVLDALEETGLSFSLMGGYAVVTWGVPRATFDVDVLVADDPQTIERFFAASERRGFDIPPEYRSGWRDRIRDLPLVKLRFWAGGRSVVTDVFVASTPFLQTVLARRREVKWPDRGKPMPVVSAADLLLFKLLAGRPKDRADVQNILTVQGIPDEPYLRDQARRLGLEKALLEALADAAS